MWYNNSTETLHEVTQKCSTFVTMGHTSKIHHGEFLQKIIDRSKKTMIEISEISGHSRTSIYRWFSEEKIDMEKIHNVAVACGVDVTGELKELDYYRSVHHKEGQASKPKESVPKHKYYDLMDKLYNTAMKLQESQERYLTSKERIEKLEKELEKRDSTGTK